MYELIYKPINATTNSQCTLIDCWIVLPQHNRELAFHQQSLRLNLLASVKYTPILYKR